MSRRGFVTPPRLNAQTLTLERNNQWWTTGSIPRNGQRIEFEGSELIWQYYANEGIQIQQLGNFGKANGLWADEKETRLRSLLDELLSLASDRGGALAFEYYFEFGGGEPPWASGLSQATALQALARASDLTGDPKYREAATRGLGLFEQAPPNGVRVDGEAGPHYLIYTFNPDLRVINAFLQSIIGLYDFAQLTGDPRAQNLYSSGEARGARRDAALQHGQLVALLALARVRPGLPQAHARLPQAALHPARHAGLLRHRAGLHGPAQDRPDDRAAHPAGARRQAGPAQVPAVEDLARRGRP